MIGEFSGLEISLVFHVFGDGYVYFFEEFEVFCEVGEVLGGSVGDFEEFVGEGDGGVEFVVGAFGVADVNYFYVTLCYRFLNL